MKKYKFQSVLQADGWHDHQVISVDDNGIITAINQTVEEAEIVEGLAVPGFQNAHSHAFQYAMAGLAEKHRTGSEADDFWSWREAMYQLALTMNPDDLEAVAAMLYTEMVKHGYTHVAEFHYLHHDKRGKPYADLAEHGARLIAAAEKAGINITLVPMFYQQGGFGQNPQERQRRFISKTTEDYYQLLAASEKATKNYIGASIGHGIHSLRAVKSEDIKEVLNDKNLNGPFHIHISEQLKEIEDSIAYQTKRPVQWLLDNTEVNDNYHLVHATHLDEEEIKGIAISGAHVVLCPSTEGNLGDGLFPLRKFQGLGGRWSIGTDSHIGINPCEELRLLDYGQRLTTHMRNTFISQNQNDSGAYCVHQALIAGRAAMGNANRSYFEVGQPLDAVVYKSSVPLLASASKENLLSTIIYASDTTWNLGTIIRGNWVVKDQVHNASESISQKFVSTIKGLNIR